MSETQQVVWKNSFTSELASNASANNKTLPIGIQKRRKSSFSSLYSPHTRRRSFLSKNMLENESLHCYRLPNYHVSSSVGTDESSLPSYSITLSESQGFVWNQDLFASGFQRPEAGAGNVLSMSDGSYYWGRTRARGSGSRSGSPTTPLVDVIDVVLTAEDYHSDVELITEFVKVRDEDDDDDDDYDEGDDDADNGHSDEMEGSYATGDAGVCRALQEEDREWRGELFRDDKIERDTNCTQHENEDCIFVSEL